jgi:hypothetical protein
MKPDDKPIEVPQMELEEIMNDSITPIWQIANPPSTTRLKRDSITIRKH